MIQFLEATSLLRIYIIRLELYYRFQYGLAAN